MNYLGFVQLNGNGSRRKFYQKNRDLLIICHQPHPFPCIDKGCVKDVSEKLIDCGLIVLDTMETVKYKGYDGTVEIDPDRGICFGKILFINDLITYKSDDIKNVYAEFVAAVDDYIQTCKELGREPNKSALHQKEGLAPFQTIQSIVNNIPKQHITNIC